MTDLTMPGMSGLDLAAALRAIRPDVRVLLLSGWLEEMPPERLAADGIRQVLKKPVLVEDLARVVRATLDA